MKTYRRFIKINGLTVGSPQFATKKQADDWYNEKRTERDKVKSGRRAGHVPTFLEYAAQKIRQWTIDYEKPTWQGYESNIRLHLLPYLRDYRINEITRAKCREVLMNVTRNGHSANHRKHVQATLSKIFTEAMNDEPPLREDNPVYRMKFDGRRQQTEFNPTFLETEQDVAAFLSAAKQLSDQHFVLACIGLMAALRRSEMIALKWKAVRWRTSEIRVSARYREAMHIITAGVKSGQEYHDVSIPAALLQVLESFRTRTEFRSDDDFILCKPDGTHWRSRSFHDRFDEIRKKAKRPDLTLHSLRHTYGRLFAAKIGNIKALQTILGHSSPATTAIYSQLSTGQVKGFADEMNYGISELKDTNDTTLTQGRKKS